tara:strand:+ start:641 stop:1318 length:678 start_codon:yes stop_codon:yes gene_type:complete
MQFLAEDFRSDPWLTYRFRKYTASPKRIPWKNMRQLKRQYQFTFCMNWLTGGLMFFPFALYFGRRMTRYQGGVPVVPYQRFVHDFPSVEPTRAARFAFRNWTFGACVVAGFIFAKYTCHDTQKHNKWFNRPDLKPYPAMANTDHMNVDGGKAKSDMMAAHYTKYKAERNASDYKNSSVFRFFFPMDASYEIKGSETARYHSDDMYDPAKGYFPSLTNDFRDHHQD